MKFGWFRSTPCIQGGTWKAPMWCFFFFHDWHVLDDTMKTCKKCGVGKGSGFGPIYYRNEL